MLIGAPPFYSTAKEKTIELIKEGKVDYSRIHRNISPNNRENIE